MQLNVEETVRRTLQSFPDWKPFGWHKNTKGLFEFNFKKNIKQVINYNYQGVEFLGKDFILKVGKGLNVDVKTPPYYQVELRSLDKNKVVYSQKKCNTSMMEFGNYDEVRPLLEKLAGPNFYLVQESDKRINLSSLVLAKNLNTK